MFREGDAEPWMRRRHKLIINIFAMTNRDDQDKELLILDVAQNAVIANAVAPHPG